MRRDVGFYVEASIDKVYNAYVLAAENEPFERDCEKQPYHTISFGVNYSFKYNFNGGACTIHFMPYRTGTAVNMRFSIAQLAGARYEKYADDLNRAMLKHLPVPLRPEEYEMDDFLKPQNQVTPSTFVAPTPIAPPVAPFVQPAAPVVPPAQSGNSFCTNCGNPLQAGNKFCSKCGSAVMVKNVCPQCNTPVHGSGAFCVNCGCKL